MSAEEKAISADPEAGAQHAVILVEETEREDNATDYDRTSFHLRAKILSVEARDLANITIPFDEKKGDLVAWWGRTILPDGTVLELRRDDLKSQTVVQSRGFKSVVLRAALSGVTSGCVIDYGYTFRDDSAVFWREVPIQTHWPVRRFRYRWRPNGVIPAQYQLGRPTDVKVEAIREKNAIVIEGRDVPSTIEEPYMPPDHVTRAVAILYYSFITPETGSAPEAFWKEVARDKEKEIGAYLKKDEPLRAVLASLNLPRDAPLDDRLRAIYEWLAANVRNRDQLTSEESEARAVQERAQREKEKKSAFAYHRKRGTLEDSLAHREAGPDELDYLLIGLARAAGAEAHLVMAAPRTSRIWVKTLLSEAQLSDQVVAVRAPGDPDERAVLLDPGSGMPYGEIPWWLTPTRALLVASEGGRDILLRSSEARRNALQTRARIRFEQDNLTALVEWSASGTGQNGYDERIDLRELPPGERVKKLDEICGAGGDFEVDHADAPNLADLSSPYLVVCKGRLVNLAVIPGQERYRFSFGGAWVPSAPELSSRTRVHPVILRFPRVDMTIIDVAPPSGFAVGPAPPPVRVETPFGSYQLRITSGPEGYRVERSLALVAVTVKVDSYPAFREFLERVHGADRTPLEFVPARGGPS